jgi:hypothetical protein
LDAIKIPPLDWLVIASSLLMLAIQGTEKGAVHSRVKIEAMLIRTSVGLWLSRNGFAALPAVRYCLGAVRDCPTCR